MLDELRDSKMRSRCKQKLESLEHWLRRLIDESLTNAYGDYFAHSDSAGNRLIASRIVNALEQRVAKEPDRYARKIDAVLLDDAIAIICNPRLYSHFRDALVTAFPDGHAEAKTFLDRLVEPRHLLAHANAISLHQAERVICYSNDVLDSLKHYYTSVGMKNDYNAPLVIRFTDSFGNTYHRDQLQPVLQGGVAKHLHETPAFDLRPGDMLTIEVEVDPAFREDEYTISWSTPKGFSQDVPDGPKAVIAITPKQVSVFFSVMCTVTSKKEWHRMMQGVDDLLMVSYRVLPPI